MAEGRKGAINGTNPFLSSFHNLQEKSRGIVANPQPTDAHLRIAHSINEQVMVSHFSEQQRRILDFILRLSWGCGNKVAYIPHQRDFEIVGVREGHVKAHLVWLVEAKVITRQDCYYQFNKDFDQWRVSRAADYTKKKLTEIVRLNLNHDKPKLTESVSENLRKREDIAYGKRKLSTSNLASPKEKLNKVLKKDIYTALFNLWNDLKIITHKKLISDMKRAIDSARKDYSEEEIEQAMRNYAVIVKGPEYYFNHKWTLAEFLSRRHSNNIERFLDLEIAKKNYRKDEKGKKEQNHEPKLGKDGWPRSI